MAEKIKERFGILIRPTGRFEIIQLGYVQTDAIRDKREIENALVEYFGGDFEWARTSDGYAYITREGAFDDGRMRNDTASWFANITLFGDVIVIPKKKDDERITWTMGDAYRRKVWMRTQWERECDYRAHPDQYKKPMKTVKA